MAHFFQEYCEKFASLALPTPSQLHVPMCKLPLDPQPLTHTSVTSPTSGAVRQAISGLYVLRAYFLPLFLMQTGEESQNPLPQVHPLATQCAHHSHAGERQRFLDNPSLPQFPSLVCNQAGEARGMRHPLLLQYTSFGPVHSLTREVRT